MVDVGVAVSALGVVVGVIGIILSVLLGAVVNRLGNISNSLARLDEKFGRIEEELRDVGKTVTRMDARSDGGNTGKNDFSGIRTSDRISYVFIDEEEVEELIKGEHEIPIRLPKSGLKLILQMKRSDGAGVMIGIETDETSINGDITDIFAEVAQEFQERRDHGGIVQQVIHPDETELFVQVNFLKYDLMANLVNNLLASFDSAASGDSPNLDDLFDSDNNF